MLSSRQKEAIRVGEEALAMATELGLDEIRAAALINIGAARGALGDAGGLAEIQEGVDIARSANAMFEMCRGIGNLAARRLSRGELVVAVEGWRQAGREAEEFGQKGFSRWFRGVVARWEYELGDWRAAAVRVDAFLGEVEQGAPHYLASQCYSCRALLRLAGGDGDGAMADAELALELGQRAKDPQAIYPVCAEAAHVMIELGERERAVAAAEEFLAGLAGRPDIGFADVFLHVLSWTLTAVGRGEEAATALEGYTNFPWARIGVAFGRGDPVGAADQCAEIGALTSEAFCRLSAARAGDLGQLEPALAFYRSVGSTRYVREGESLLAAAG